MRQPWPRQLAPAPISGRARGCWAGPGGLGGAPARPPAAARPLRRGPRPQWGRPHPPLGPQRRPAAPARRGPPCSPPALPCSGWTPPPRPWPTGGRAWRRGAGCCWPCPPRAASRNGTRPPGRRPGALQRPAAARGQRPAPGRRPLRAGAAPRPNPHLLPAAATRCPGGPLPALRAIAAIGADASQCPPLSPGAWRRLLAAWPAGGQLSWEVLLLLARKPHTHTPQGDTPCSW